jgi:hypothetical protein
MVDVETVSNLCVPGAKIRLCTLYSSGEGVVDQEGVGSVVVVTMPLAS